MSQSIREECPICFSMAEPTSIIDAPHDLGLPLGAEETWRFWNCPRCGDFFSGRFFDIEAWTPKNYLGPRDSRKRANLSAWFRQKTDRHEGPYPYLAISFLDRESEDDLRIQFDALKEPSFHQKADILLQALRDETQKAGQGLDLSKHQETWCARAWALDKDELLEFIIYLSSQGHIRPTGMAIGKASFGPLAIIADGWARLEQLDRERSESDQGFVAMAFSENMKPLFDNALRPAIWAAGYRPLRIDMVDHANRIPDEIEVAIKASKFIVADLTCDNFGVIYEMGFARGLSLVTILTRLADELSSQGHFDYKQINTLPWDDIEKLDIFAKKLRNRIINLCGKGPAKPPKEEYEILREKFPELFRD